jgi:hypothetical protein
MRSSRSSAEFYCPWPVSPAFVWEQWSVCFSSDEKVDRLVTVGFAPTAQPPWLDIKRARKALKRFIPKVTSRFVERSFAFFVPRRSLVLASLALALARPPNPNPNPCIMKFLGTTPIHVALVWPVSVLVVHCKW